MRVTFHDHPSHQVREEDLPILAYDPFAGDRDSDITLFSDRMVVAAKAHPQCAICFGPIAKGERHRARTERDNDDQVVMTFRFCAACCSAMAAANEDAGKAIEERTVLGISRAMSTEQEEA